MRVPGKQQCLVLTRTFLDSAIPMFWLREDEVYMYNESFVNFSGYSSKDLDNMTFKDLHHPDNEAENLSDIHGPGHVREPKVFTWAMKLPSGEPRPLELRLTRFYVEHDDATYFYGVARKLTFEDDPTQIFMSKGTSARLALEAAEQSMLEYFVPSEEFTFSEQFYKLTGYTKRTIEGDSAIRDSIHAEDIDKVKRKWLAMLSGRTHSDTFEFRFRKKSGEYVWLSSRCITMAYRANGKALRVTGVVRDMHSQRENIDKLKSQAQKIIDYAYINSHELRGPLASILGLVDLLDEGYSRDTVNHLKSVAQQLDCVVHRINHTLTEGYPLEFPPIKSS